jgi:Tol biopolymer transport system component
MNADGSGVDQLTDNAFYDRHPKWSPDGTRIAFESYREGNWEIMVMNANGTGEVQLTHDGGYDFEPDWSPDSSRITWRTGQYDGVGDIAVMNADGTGGTDLTQGDPAYDREPAWAPDGLKIAYASVQTDNFDIRTMSQTGDAKVTITSHPGNDYDPDWQPAPVTLTVTKLGTGTGAVLSRPAGIRCGSDCSNAYGGGTTVKLRAFAASGSTFSGWGGACSGTGACTVVMDGSKSVTATFAST